MNSFAVELESLRSKIEKQFSDHPPLHGPVPTIYLSLQGYGNNKNIYDLYNDAFELSFRKFEKFEKFLYEVYNDDEKGIASIDRLKKDF